jgi:hypothetical protein
MRTALPIRSRALRAGCALMAAFLAAACSSDSNSNWSQIVDAASDRLAGDDGVTLDQAAKVPFASLGVRYGGGPQHMMVLASDTQGTLMWTSAARIVLMTRHGRIERTAGLAKNLSETVLESQDPLQYFLEGRTEEREATRIVDLRDIDKFSVPLSCKLSLRGNASVEILRQNIATRLVEEECENQDLDWSFTNQFWIGAHGMVWKSVQYIHPGVDPIEIEVLRPPDDAF